MMIYEYKHPEDTDWSVLEYPPFNNWTEFKSLAEKWNIHIRAINPDTMLVEREYYPYAGTRTG